MAIIPLMPQGVEHETEKVLTKRERAQAIGRIERQLAVIFSELFALGLVWVTLGYPLDEYLRLIRAKIEGISARLKDRRRDQ